VALTGTQKAKIRKYLGWSARFVQFDRALDGAFEAIATTPEQEAEVVIDLDECIRLDAAIVAAEARLKATSVGPIDLNGGEIGALRARGRTHVGRIATALGVEVREDSFGPDLPRFRAGPWGPSGGGNQQRHG